MKVCTITCHDVYNHGASLQAYGLMTYLKNNGHDVEIIDYKPNYLGNLYNMLSVDNPRWEKNLITKWAYITLKAPIKIRSLKRKRAFDKFTKERLKVTERTYTNNEELKENTPQADAYLCGSDQIWNSLHKNGRDPAFYLDFVPDNKIKASYAASMAIDKVPDECVDLVKSKVSRLDKVALRESSGVRVLKGLGIDNAIQVVDPALLLDHKEWSKISECKFNEKFILVYDFDRSSVIEKVAKDIAKAKGYKIYTLNIDKPDYSDKSFRYSGPQTFISLVKHAEFVVSNSFHAAIFSLIFKKNFNIVNRTEAINTRMRDLLTDLNIGERLIGADYKVEELIKDIDYSKVDKILNEKIEFSKKYLEELLA
ncbi:polysaccharide pyruvyl transferase family protein [Clostridium tarantellae]|uniref:Polysaccharide pyruvyl transferase family protein n=1 Tax=Clostridium tarantellae TaxID=39493 RepID=A0A6I1MIQ0_9CLOT|nr:polysaccharide pyruvyl transferase family protein [Clostridium tarantellae]MPQ42278.1 polysaccharide pyruvyl transferase family protein [Clostridium tarantellae]